jgi:predicted CopG family antitoxin
VHKTIGLDESAYERLKAAKMPGESFSDVVRRLLAPSGSWRDLVGILRDDGAAMAAWLKQHRAAERAAARERWR